MQTTDKIIQTKHDIPGVRRSIRVSIQTKVYPPSLSGNKYSYTLKQMENMVILHPESHMLFNPGITRHDPDFVEAIMTPLPLKAGLNRWGNKVSGAINS